MLTKTVHEAKQELGRTFDELEHHCRVVEELNGQLRRPHACWPSRWGFGTVLALLLYLFFFSTGRMEQEMHKALEQRLITFEQRLIEVEVLKAHTHPIAKKRWWQR